MNDIDQLAPALVAAQSQFPKCEKNAINPHMRNKYADLESIITAVRAPLGREGLSLLQLVSTEPFGDVYDKSVTDKFGKTKVCKARCVDVVITTILQHTSGQRISTETRMCCDNGFDPHAIGSCITYGRRYSLVSMLCLATGEGEDDGSAARGDREERQPKRAEKDADRLEIVSPLLRNAGAKSSEDARRLLEEFGLRFIQDDYRVNSEGRVIWPSIRDYDFAKFCQWLGSRKPASEQTSEPEPAEKPAEPVPSNVDEAAVTTIGPKTAADAHRALRTMLRQMGANSADKAAGILATWGISATLQGGKIDWSAISLEDALKAPAAVWRGDVGALPNE